MDEGSSESPDARAGRPAATGNTVGEASGIRSFYRVAKSYPPTEDDYRTRKDRQGDPPAHVPEAVRRSWDALSAFDSEEGARRQARRFPRLGRFIVRYDIPPGAGVSFEQTLGPGHYDLRGDKFELHRYLADFVVEV
jgi:hypothetical protein